MKIFNIEIFAIYGIMVLWFVDKKVAELALKQALLIEEHVKCWITDAVVDENVDIHLIRKYVAYDTRLLVEQVLMRKQKMTLDL